MWGDEQESILGGFKKKTDGDRSNKRSGSTLAVRIENLGDVDKIKADHGGHGLEGGREQGGGRGLGGGQVTCFAIVPSPNIFRRGAIKELSRPSCGRQTAQ